MQKKIAYMFYTLCLLFNVYFLNPSSESFDTISSLNSFIQHYNRISKTISETKAK